MMSKEEEVAHWRIAKGAIAENCFEVAVSALKACGTGSTGFTSPISRGLRDLAMALVQGFPPERGRLGAAEYLVFGKETPQFGTVK